jgi:dCTP diphosphatase
MTESQTPSRSASPALDADDEGTGRKHDDNVTLGELRARLAAFTAARDWEQFHSPRNLAISIAIEAAELLEHYQWHEARGAQKGFDAKQFQAEVAAELADILIYCLHFANATDTDVAQAILDKLARNETRFPAAAVRGRVGDG